MIIGLKDIFAAHTFACFILKLANIIVSKMHSIVDVKIDENCCKQTLASLP